MKVPTATREQVEQLLERFKTPQERLHVPNWPQVKAGLRIEAQRYGLELPSYLKGEAGEEANGGR